MTLTPRELAILLVHGACDLLSPRRRTGVPSKVATMVCELLLEVHRRCRKPVTIVLDNASYHRAKVVRELAETLGIELLFLPPYSPNLNLIERAWKLVKKLALNARMLPDFDAFATSVMQTVENLEGEHRDKLLTLFTPNFQDFNDVQLSAA